MSNNQTQFPVVCDLLGSAVEDVKIPEFKSDSLSFLADELVSAVQVLGVDARVGGRQDLALSLQQPVDGVAARRARDRRAHYISIWPMQIQTLSKPLPSYYGS